MSAGEEPLENDPRNGCVGCGPANPRGLRLAFARRGDEVRGDLLPTADMEGWPGRLHSGLLYLALLETANWSAYGLTGRVGVPVRTSALETAGWVATGTPLRLVGRRAAGEPFVILAEGSDPGGRVVGRLSRSYEFPDAASFAARMGYERIPEVFEGAFP